MISIGVGVKRINNRIPGVVVDRAPPIEPFVKDIWYQIEWVDGNVSEEPEHLLDILRPTSRQLVEL